MSEAEKYKKYVDFLYKKNCQNVQHSHSNFLNHCIGVFNILKKWKQPDYICIAGMFHNIYGNKYFNPNLNISRKEIKELVGDNIEDLIYRFINSDRTKIYDSDDSELILLNLANSLDQRKLFLVEDNLYDLESAKNAYDYFKSLSWTLDGGSVTEKSKKWNYYLNYKHPIEKNFLLISNLLLKKHGLNKIFMLARSYASAGTYGYGSEYHIDDGAKELNEIVTVMFYLNDNWDINFGGETFFLNETKDEIEHAIIPKPRRAVLFDGFITHGARPLTKFCDELRIVLTFKYELINR